MIKTIIHDGESIAKVSEHGAVHVSLAQHPTMEEQTVFPFRTLLSLNGAGVTTDMRVNGAVTNQTFSIIANDDEDIFVTHIAFTLADAAAVFSSFGALTALTNGCLFRWKTSARTVVLHPNIRSNFDLVQACLFEPAFGDAIGAFRGLNVVGTSEAYFPVLDFTKLLPFYGLRLVQGSLDKIEFIIRDNISAGLDRFDAVVYGFIHTH